MPTPPLPESPPSGDRKPTLDPFATLPPQAPSSRDPLCQQDQEVSDEGICPEHPEQLEKLKRLLKEMASIESAPGIGVPEATGNYSTERPGEVAEGLTLPPAPGAGKSVPETIPGYEILGELGRGGMGVVYKARQIGLKRIVALKMILNAQYAADDVRGRFRLEAEAVARLQHPHIVQIHDIGEHDGTPFFSLEFCPGGSLDRKLGGVPMEPRTAAELLEVLARAVHAAHLANVIHRDLKPANILLAACGLAEEGAAKPQAADWIPKITDFGLAKKLDEVGQTQTGAVMGTPSYMAPEQAEGKKNIGPPADIYALGAILYEMLTGRPPFRAATTFDTILQVVADEPVPPTQLNPKVPRDLETICLKCLSKEPARRYASALDLAEDVRRFHSGNAIHGRRTPAWERAWKWARRRPTTAALIVALALAGLGVMAGGVFYGLYKDQQATALRRQFERDRKIDSMLDQGKEAEAAGRLALAEGRNEDAARLFAAAAQHLDGALTTLDAEPEVHEDSLRAQIEEHRDQVRQHLEEYEARRRIQSKVSAFMTDYHEVLFHEISPTDLYQASNREQVLRLAPAALARFGVSAEWSAKSVRALTAERERFASPQQFTQVVEVCYKILLVWAEAAVVAPPGIKEPAAAGAQRRAWLAGVGARDWQGARDGDAAGVSHPPSALPNAGGRYGGSSGGPGPCQGNAVAHRSGSFPGRDGVLAQGGCGASGPGLRRDVATSGGSFLGTIPASPLSAARESLGRGQGGVDRLPGPPARVPLGSPPAHSAHVELNDLAAAEEDFDRVLKESTDPVQRYVALVNRMPLRMKQKRAADALVDLEQAIKLFPTDHRAYVNRAQIYGARRDWARAIGELSWAIKVLEPKVDPLLHYSRAFAYLERKDRPAARADFAKVVALGPEGGMEER